MKRIALIKVSHSYNIPCCVTPVPGNDCKMTEQSSYHSSAMHSPLALQASQQNGHKPNQQNGHKPDQQNGHQPEARAEPTKQDVHVGDSVGMSARNPLDLIKSDAPLLSEAKSSKQPRALAPLVEAAGRDETCVWYRVRTCCCCSVLTAAAGHSVHRVSLGVVLVPKYSMLSHPQSGLPSHMTDQDSRTTVTYASIYPSGLIPSSSFSGYRPTQCVRQSPQKQFVHKDNLCQPVHW